MQLYQFITEIFLCIRQHGNEQSSRSLIDSLPGSLRVFYYRSLEVGRELITLLKMRSLRVYGVQFYR